MNENFKVIRSWDLKALGYVVGFLLGRDGFGYKNPKARPKYAVLFGMNAKSRVTLHRSGALQDMVTGQ